MIDVKRGCEDSYLSNNECYCIRKGRTTKVSRTTSKYRENRFQKERLVC